MKFNITEEQRKKIDNLMFQLQPHQRYMVEFDKNILEFVPKEVEVFETEEQCRKACMIKMKMIAVYLGVGEE